MAKPQLKFDLVQLSRARTRKMQSTMLHLFSQAINGSLDELEQLYRYKSKLDVWSTNRRSLGSANGGYAIPRLLRTTFCSGKALFRLNEWPGYKYQVYSSGSLELQGNTRFFTQVFALKADEDGLYIATHAVYFQAAQPAGLPCTTVSTQSTPPGAAITVKRVRVEAKQHISTPNASQPIPTLTTAIGTAAAITAKPAVPEMPPTPTSDAAATAHANPTGNDSPTKPVQPPVTFGLGSKEAGIAMFGKFFRFLQLTPVYLTNFYRGESILTVSSMHDGDVTCTTDISVLQSKDAQHECSLGGAEAEYSITDLQPNADGGCTIKASGRLTRKGALRDFTMYFTTAEDAMYNVYIRNHTIELVKAGTITQADASKGSEQSMTTPATEECETTLAAPVAAAPSFAMPQKAGAVNAVKANAAPAAACDSNKPVQSPPGRPALGNPDVPGSVPPAAPALSRNARRKAAKARAAAAAAAAAIVAQPVQGSARQGLPAPPQPAHPSFTQATTKATATANANNGVISPAEPEKPRTPTRDAAAAAHAKPPTIGVPHMGCSPTTGNKAAQTPQMQTSVQAAEVPGLQAGKAAAGPVSSVAASAADGYSGSWPTLQASHPMNKPALTAQEPAKVSGNKKQKQPSAASAKDGLAKLVTPPPGCAPRGMSPVTETAKLAGKPSQNPVANFKAEKVVSPATVIGAVAEPVKPSTPPQHPPARVVGSASEDTTKPGKGRSGRGKQGKGTKPAAPAAAPANAAQTAAVHPDQSADGTGRSKNPAQDFVKKATGIQTSPQAAGLTTTQTKQSGLVIADGNKQAETRSSHVATGQQGPNKQGAATTAPGKQQQQQGGTGGAQSQGQSQQVQKDNEGVEKVACGGRKNRGKGRPMDLKALFQPVPAFPAWKQLHPAAPAYVACGA